MTQEEFKVRYADNLKRTKELREKIEDILRQNKSSLPAGNIRLSASGVPMAVVRETVEIRNRATIAA